MWVEALQTFNCTAETTRHLFFNHVIARFGVPLQLVTKHGSHFEETILKEFSYLLKFKHQFSNPYITPRVMDRWRPSTKSWKQYSNERWISTNLIGIVFFLQFFGITKYKKKTITWFTPFHLVDVVESVLPIEFQILSLHLTVEVPPENTSIEKHFLTLEKEYEDRHVAL